MFSRFARKSIWGCAGNIGRQKPAISTASALPRIQFAAASWGQLQRDPLLPAPHGPHEHLGPGGVRQPGVRAADGGGTQGGRIAEFPLRPGGGGSVDH